MKLRIVDLFGIIVYKFLLDFAYKDIISTVFAYDGYVYNINIAHYIEGWVVVFIMYFLLIKKESMKMFTSLFISYLFIIFPATTLYAFNNNLTANFYIIVGSLTFILLCTRSHKINLSRSKWGHQFIVYFSILSTIAVILHYLSVKGFSNINFNFETVYAYRSKFGKNDNANIFGYLNSIVPKCFNILLIIWSINKNNKILLSLFIGLQILIFGLSGHKAVLFYPIFAVFFYLIRNYKRNSSLLSFAFSLTILVSLIFYKYFDNIIIPSVFVRRNLILPSQIINNYLDFFSVNNYVIWSNGILSKFSNYPYDLSATHVIGDYMGDSEMGANTGFIGSGYMHAGIIGILIYCLIISAFINAMERINSPKWLINSIIIIPFITAMNSSDLFTSLLTHGLLIAGVSLYFFDETSNKKTL